MALAFLASAEPSPATLEDQFGNSVRLAIGSGRAVLVIASDRRSAAEDIADWSRALGSLPSSVDLYRVASLAALPFFVPRAAVAKDLRERQAGLAILLDWKGGLAAALKAPRKGIALLALGPEGRELGRVEGPASPEGAARARRLLGLE